MAPVNGEKSGHGVMCLQLGGNSQEQWGVKLTIEY